MRAEARDALVVATLGGAAAITLATPWLPMPLRAVAAGALAFALPGAGILAASMPRVRWRRSERVVLSLGGSLTIAIASAFLLNVSPGGLSAAGWAGLLGAVTLLGGLIGWMRASRVPVAGAGGVDLAPVPSATPEAGREGATSTVALTAVSPMAVAMLVGAGLLVVLSLVIARSGVALGPTASFAELWLLRADGDQAVRVGLANHEGEEQAYRLVVTVDGRRLGDPLELTLADGAATDLRIALPARGTGDRLVEVRLWHADESSGSQPLRAVRATLTDPEGGA